MNYSGFMLVLLFVVSNPKLPVLDHEVNSKTSENTYTELKVAC